MLLVCLFAGCGPSENSNAPAGYVFDQGNPKEVLQVVFDVASGKAAPAILAQICSESLTKGPETQRICDYAKGFDPEGEFPMFFGRGKLEAGGLVDGELAYQSFSYGPMGQQIDTMVMVLSEGKWYLSYF